MALIGSSAARWRQSIRRRAGGAAQSDRRARNARPSQNVLRTPSGTRLGSAPRRRFHQDCDRRRADIIRPRSGTTSTSPPPPRRRGGRDQP
jgi:hypothetical protein